MGLFNSSCCPSKPKRTMDYILNWIDTNSLIIAKNTSFINDLIEWRRSIENDLDDHVKTVADEYITNYDWSKVPQFDVLSRSIATKVDKVENATEGHFASLDFNGNLQDSGYEASNFANANHSHNGINLGGNVANHILIEEVGSIGRFHVQLWDSQEEEPVFSNYITEAMLDNTFHPATAPAQGDQKLITSGAVYNYSPRAISNAGYGVSIDEDGEIHIGSDYVVIGVDGGEAEINSDNIDNLNRALTTPSSIPEDDATKLITSKAVYDALAGKMNEILTLRIDVDTSDDDYPMTTGAGSLLSTFVDNVSVGTHVPVMVELHTQSATLGTVLGIAKWTLEGQEDEHDVEIRIGRLLFSTYRRADEQQQWGDFTDWTKSPSQEIEDYFL